MISEDTEDWNDAKKSALNHRNELHLHICKLRTVILNEYDF